MISVLKNVAALLLFMIFDILISGIHFGCVRESLMEMGRYCDQI